MSLDSKHKKMKKVNNLFIIFKNIKLRKPNIKLKKERIMKNVEELYERYYHAYKDDYDTNNELNKAKKKEFNYTKFKLRKKADSIAKMVEL